MKQITVRNNIFQHVQVLKTNRKKRNQYREFVVEGVRNINEAVKTKENYCFSEELMRELSGKEDTSELMAIVKMKEISPSMINSRETPFFVLFDRPSNKGNLGSVIRSCDALGADGLFMTGHGVDLYDPEVIATSMGSFFLYL